MEISQIKNFLAVLDRGSISGAANSLGLAQPALSQSITRLEKKLKVRLFDRSRNGASPTPAALAIVDDLRSVMLSLEQAERRTVAARKGLAGSITIGIVSSALFDVLPTALASLRSAAPDMQVNLKELSNAEQAKALESGTIDIALMHAPVSVSGHVYERVLRRDKLLAAVPSTIAASLNSSLTVKEIAALGLIMYPEEQLPVLYMEIADGLRKAGCPFKVNMHANRTLTVLACVAGGMGVGLLPSWIRSVSFPGVTFMDIKDGDVLPDFDLVALCPARSAYLMPLLFP